MSIQFVLIDVATKQECFSSTNIQEVNERANALKAKGTKTQIKRMQSQQMDNAVWISREAERLRSGHYEPLPQSWVDAPWFDKVPETKLHFAHVASDGQRIAYTPNAEAGFADKHLVLAPNRYLANFFGKHLRPDEISRLSNAFTARKFSITIEDTPEAFTFSYEQKHLKNMSSSAESCMGYPASHFHMKHHPAVAYAAGDLAIAYIRDPQNTSVILARTVVWPAKKLGSRPYGTDERMRDIIRALLEQDGYTVNHNLQGARIAAIPAAHTGRDKPTPNKGYVFYTVPYIDGGCNLKWGEGNDHFVLTESTAGAVAQGTSTCGYLSVRRPLRAGEINCDNCSTPTTEYNQVHGTISNQYRWCPNCTTQHAFRCEITETWRQNGLPQDDVMVQATPEIRRVVGWIDSANVAECYRTGEFFDTRIFGPLVRVRNAAGEIEEICSAFRVAEDQDEPVQTRRRSRPSREIGDAVAELAGAVRSPNFPSGDWIIEPTVLRAFTPRGTN